jgi:hypothetical protein
MARVEIPAPGDLIMDSAGNVRVGEAVSLKLAGTGTDATHYSALTAGTSTTGGLTTGSDGTIIDGSGNRRYVEEGSYDLTILGRSRQIEATSGSVTANLPINAKASPYKARGDGSTNDTAALQAALAAASSGSRALYIPAGTYLLGAQLTLPSNVEVFGDGMDRTILKVGTGTTESHPIQNADTTNGNTNITVRDLTIDGNKAAITGDPDVTANPNQSVWIAGGDAAPCTNIVFERVRVHDCKRLGLAFANVQVGAIRDCIVEDNDRDGITLYYNCKDVQITGNTIKRCADDHIGINAENDVTTGHTLERIKVRGNIIVGGSSRNKGKGIMVRGGERISIVDNTIDSVSESAIQLGDFNTTWLREVVVSGNIIKAAGTSGSSAKDGILVYANDPNNHASVTYSGIDGVTVSGNRIKGCLGKGINVNSGHGSLTSVTGVAATDLFTKTAHGLLAGQAVAFSALTGGTGLTAGTIYYVIASGLTANAFKISATSGGAALDFTTDVTAATLNTVGECLNIKVTENTVRDSTSYGIYVSDQGISDVDIERNRVSGNLDRGINVDGASLRRIFVEDNKAWDNTNEGVYVFGVTDGSCWANRAWDTRAGGARTQTIGIRVSTVLSHFRMGGSNAAWNNTASQYSYTSVPSSAFEESFFNQTPQNKQTIAAAGTDAATTQTLANDLRTKLTTYGLF